jgi:hypothetical protein
MDSFPNRLREAIDRSPDLAPSPEFIARLRKDLQARAGSSGRRRAALWFGLAASLLVAIGAGTAYWTSAERTNARARAAAGDHVACALKMSLPEGGISLEEAANRFGPAFRAIERVPALDVQTAAGVAHVVDRHSCVYQGRRFGHVILSYRGSTVSLMVTPADPRLSARSIRIGDMNVVTTRAGRQALFIAGDTSMNDLAVLADAIFGPLARELGGA